MGERPTDRAPVANLGVSHLARHVGEDRDLGGQQLGGLQVPVPGESTDGDVVAGVAHIRELVQTADVDKHRRHGEAQLHERQQGMPSGEQLGLVAVRGEQAEGLVDRRHPLIVERNRDHGRPSCPMPRIACQTRSGVAGMSRSRTPKGARASITAFMTAGVAAMVPVSPTPFTPIGLVGLGVTVRPTSMLGTSAAEGTR